MCVRKRIWDVFVLVFLGYVSNYPAAVLASGSEHEGHSVQKKMQESNRKQLSKDEAASVSQVFKANEDLHGAFFDYKPANAEAQARKLASAIDSLEVKEIKKLLKFSAGKLKEIRATNSRKENNKIYHMFSTALIHILNNYDVPGSYNAYYCPMVKMNWVQNSEILAKTQNPYAPEMKMCGDKKSSF